MIAGFRPRGKRIRVVNVGCSVARLGRARTVLVRTGRGTRAVSHLGDTFLTGVDRRVHAPLGTVINFSNLLISARSVRRHYRCVGVMRRGGSLLLRLVSSVLSLSGVRTNAFRFACKRASIGVLYRSVIHDSRVGIPRKIRLMFSPRPSSYAIVDSQGQLRRIVSGFIGGTLGFASSNDVRIKCRGGRRNIRFCMDSAKVKVSGRRLARVFRHFIGLGDFVRKAKLKLSVYGDVIRRLNNIVKISSRRKGKSHF